MNGSIELRPHHGLCIHFFEGKGYSPTFVENMQSVIAQLHAQPQQEIRLVCRADVLCRACPHNSPAGCASGQKPVEYDRHLLALCGLVEGETIPWQAYTRLIHDRVLAAGQGKAVCGDCSWAQLCHRAL